MTASMERVIIPILMARNIKVNGNMVKEVAMVFSSLLMAQLNMMVNGETINIMEMEL